MSQARLMVIIPTLGERLGELAEALESCGELRGVVPTTTVVVVPDSATEARALAQKHGAVILSDPGTGMADAVNLALTKRTSEQYSVWLGDDDRLVPEGLAQLVEALDYDVGAVVAYGQLDYIDSAGALGMTNRAGRLAQFLLPWGPNLIPHPGTVIRLDALEAIGAYDSALKYALDLDVFLKLKRMGKFLTRPVVTAQFRWHPESLTVANRRASSAEAMAIKRSHLPRWLRGVSPLWQVPVAIASHFAAEGMNRRFLRMATPK